MHHKKFWLQWKNNLLKVWKLNSFKKNWLQYIVNYRKFSSISAAIFCRWSPCTSWLGKHHRLLKRCILSTIQQKIFLSWNSSTWLICLSRNNRQRSCPTVCPTQCPMTHGILFRLREFIFGIPRLYCFLFQDLLRKDHSQHIRSLLTQFATTRRFQRHFSRLQTASTPY